MIELSEITTGNLSAYAPYIRAEAVSSFGAGETAGFGLAEDEKPFAAIVFRDTGEGAAHVLSLYVDEVYRRKGYGTELMTAAMDFLIAMGGVYRMTVDATRFESDREDTLHLFLQAFESEIETGVAGCFGTTLGKARAVKVLQAVPPQEITPYGKLSPFRKKCLYDEPIDLSDMMQEGTIEEDMSCVFLKDDAIDACVIFEKDEDGLTVAWARTSQSAPVRIILLLQYAIAHATAYDDDCPVHIPVLNAESERLMMRLLGDDAKRVESGYRATIPLFGEM